MIVNNRNTLTHTNEHTSRILDVTGYQIHVDNNGNSEFVRRNDVNIMCLGDNSWGNVTVAFTAQGHLVLAAHFGDDGYYLFSPTITSKTELTSDLSDEFRSLLDEDDIAHDVSLIVNPLSEYSISQSFSC